MFNPFARVESKFGAPMGRVSGWRKTAKETTSPTLYIRRAKWVDEAYDQGGAYWGMGNPIFAAFTYTGTFVQYVRAKDADEALALMRAAFPAAKFKHLPYLRIAKEILPCLD